MAFQPIVDARAGWVLGYEALARGPMGQPAISVLAQLDADNVQAFDQQSRVAAVRWARRLNLDGMLAINFSPNAVTNPDACIGSTLLALHAAGWGTGRVIFELGAARANMDREHLLDILHCYRDYGFKTAFDDFGTGPADLALLAGFQPDFIKLDMALVAGVARRESSRIIVRNLVRLCEELDCKPIAEGVERPDQALALVDLGVRLQQGFLYAKPGFQQLPQPSFGAAVPALADDAPAG